MSIAPKLCNLLFILSIALLAPVHGANNNSELLKESLLTCTPDDFTTRYYDIAERENPNFFTIKKLLKKYVDKQSRVSVREEARIADNLLRNILRERVMQDLAQEGIYLDTENKDLKDKVYPRERKAKRELLKKLIGNKKHNKTPFIQKYLVDNNYLLWFHQKGNKYRQADDGEQIRWELEEIKKNNRLGEYEKYIHPTWRSVGNRTGRWYDPTFDFRENFKILCSEFKNFNPRVALQHQQAKQNLDTKDKSDVDVIDKDSKTSTASVGKGRPSMFWAGIVVFVVVVITGAVVVVDKKQVKKKKEKEEKTLKSKATKAYAKLASFFDTKKAKKKR